MTSRISRGGRRVSTAGSSLKPSKPNSCSNEKSMTSRARSGRSNWKVMRPKRCWSKWEMPATPRTLSSTRGWRRSCEPYRFVTCDCWTSITSPLRSWRWLRIRKCLMLRFPRTSTTRNYRRGKKPSSKSTRASSNSALCFPIEMTQSTTRLIGSTQ